MIATKKDLKRVQKIREEKGKYEAFIEASKVIHEWAQKKLTITGSNFKVEGLENIPDENCIFIANHQSDFDIALFLALLKKPHTFLYKKEMRKVPILVDWLDLIDGSIIDRESARNTMSEILKAIDNAKNGFSIVIFPEGTRSKSKKMAEFKDGAFKVAFKSKKPIVPVVINGTYKILEQNKMAIKPADVTMKFLKPISTDNLKKGEDKEIIEKVHALIKQELDNIPN